MSGSIASFRGKLAAAGQLGSVVRAMKAIAAASIGQYEAAIAALSDYERSVELGLSACLRGRPGAPSKSAAAGKDVPVGAVIFGSDQGMVGQFNSIIADFTRQALQRLPGRQLLWVVGEQLHAAMQTSGPAIDKTYPLPGSAAAIAPLIAQIQLEVEKYSAANLDARILVFHNRPKSAARFEPVCQELLPLDQAWRNRMTAIQWPGHRLPEILGDGDSALRALIHEKVFIGLYKSCAQSQASENGSRLAAMQRAQDNIETISRDLTTALNRLRQSSIDDELFDVIAGFDSLLVAPRAAGRRKSL
jgi:F-type H+-transporting ATPase subunit gamma